MIDIERSERGRMRDIRAWERYIHRERIDRREGKRERDQREGEREREKEGDQREGDREREIRDRER